MSFGNTAIYPFPAVQYIPLPVTTITSGNIRGIESKAAVPLLIVDNDLYKWRMILKNEFNLEFPDSWPKDSFPLLTLNCNVDEVKYRSFFVTMIGKAIPSHYQLFYLPKRYFYKKKLYFELFDRKSAQRLARYSLFMSESN